MELLLSKKLKLPTVYFITDRTEIKEVPIGIPFIFGDDSIKKFIIKILEYEVLYQAAVDSGYPFDFKKILKENGYRDLKSFGYSNPAYIDYSSSETATTDYELEDSKMLSSGCPLLKEFTKDVSSYIDITVLKSLNVFPVWLDKIEEAIHTNIHNFATYNPNMYNKKLEGIYGGIDLKPPSKNLIIIDISGSIPKAVSSTCLALAKNLSETFYADLLITGSKSTIYSYEDIPSLDINLMYKENGMGNDQNWFKDLVTKDARKYSTAIVFGDNHHPGYPWINEFSKKARKISDIEGQKLCQWTIDKLISFHTSNTIGNEGKDSLPVAGYARWFKPTEIEHIHNWVTYLK